MRLAIDAMGGDEAPAAVVEGALRFARAHPGHQVILVGDAERVRPLTLEVGSPAPRNVIVHHASEII
ncbi:MAG TPA: phosphate acyltransferase, partial [Myxococcaceae bacterium]|nr:phosphate acyltransferase [Myxococcaceae bacterium]